jgi:magnesium chelatase subunit D
VTPIFPFSAVLGQQRLKLALLLCAIDPGVGGVLVQGPRGVAKTTLARAFAELLPGRFVELPLGATEERVAGSLDLGKVLGQGEVHFSPGLLARAHDGVLYVDEVNLLPDALVDLLLDAAATGTNVVERDGVSHVHPARFVLVGTMNPEEGELRPQLCDRFGLSVAADAMLTPEQRTEVVLRRLEFEQDAAAFVARYAPEQQALVERCRAARVRAAALPFSGGGVARAAELCHQARVEGVRADLAMLRAARAHAAWNERSEISVADVDAVAELALAHRRPAPGSGGGGGGGARGSGPPPAGAAGEGRAGERDGRAGNSGAGNSGAGNTSADAPRGGSSAAAPARGDASGAASGARGPEGTRDPGRSSILSPVPVRSVEAGRLPAWLTSAPPLPRSMAAGQRRRRGPGALGRGSIDWIATLAQAQRTTPAASSGPASPSGSLRRWSLGSIELLRRSRRLASPAFWVIAVDCSASMLRSGALGRAKGIAQRLAVQAGRASAQVRLVTFGGGGVHVAPGARRGQHGIDAALAAAGAGGGTPLGHAVQRAHELCAARGQQAPGTQHRVFLLTDGRVQQPLHLPGAPPHGTDAWVVDLELGPVRLGRAIGIASALGARYVHADSLSPPANERGAR